MIDISIANYIHHKSIEAFGGSRGIRDIAGLEAAINRPFATFDGVELYSTPIEKAAAILESILINHPFIDGNKRTGYLLMKYLLYKSGIFISATESEKYEMVIGASTGTIRFEEIKLWLLSHTEN